MIVTGNQAASEIGNLRRGKHIVWAGGEQVRKVVRHNAMIYLYLKDKDGKPIGAWGMHIEEMVSIEPTFGNNYVVISKGMK